MVKVPAAIAELISGVAAATLSPMRATGLWIPLGVAALLAALLATPAQAQNGDGSAASTGILPLLDYSGSLWERSRTKWTRSIHGRTILSKLGYVIGQAHHSLTVLAKETEPTI